MAGRIRPSTAKDLAGTKKPASSKSGQRPDTSPNRDLKEVIKPREEGKKSITLLHSQKPRGASGSKSTRTIIRPETAKPPQAKAEAKEERSKSAGKRSNAQLGFNAQQFNLVRTNAVNTNDLSAQLNKDKKFQMLKKLKEEKEKKREVVVRNV